MTPCRLRASIVASITGILLCAALLGPAVGVADAAPRTVAVTASERAARWVDTPQGPVVQRLTEVGRDVISAFPDVQLSVDSSAGVDPYRQHQWGLDAITADRLLPGERGDGVTIAVIDSGVSETHPDLQHAVVEGWSVTGGDAHDDVHGHGTAVAGVIAAAAGDGWGMAGVADGVSIMPLQVVGADGTAWASDVAQAIIEAVDRGADLLNISLTTVGDAPVLRDAVAYAVGSGVGVVASAGNLGAQGNPVVYPAAYDGVLAVAAIDRDLQPASFSSFGPWVDLAAPGVGIFTTSPDGSFVVENGGSFAAPHVAATVAVLMAAAGDGAAAAIATVLQTAGDLEQPGRDDRTGMGALDLAAALAAGARHDISVQDPVVTAAEMSRAAAGVQRATHAVLVSQDGWADALAATAVAGIGNPILLAGARLPMATATALQRALPPGSTVYLLGGEAVLAPAVMDDVAALGYVPQRVGGASRVDTAALAAELSGGLRGPTRRVLLASAAGWADAVAAGPVAARDASPILLTDGGALSPRTAQALAALGPDEVVVLGGEAVISAAVLSQVADAIGVTPRRVHGTDRRATAVSVATELGGRHRGATVIAGFAEHGWVAGLSAAPTGLSILMADGSGALDQTSTDFLQSIERARVIDAA